MGCAKRTSETYNSGDSPVVTRRTTDPLVHCLFMAERAGSLVRSLLITMNVPKSPVLVDQPGNTQARLWVLSRYGRRTQPRVYYGVFQRC